jgi:hypothetical protein
MRRWKREWLDAESEEKSKLSVIERIVTVWPHAEDFRHQRGSSSPCLHENAYTMGAIAEDAGFNPESFKGLLR